MVKRMIHAALAALPLLLAGCHDRKNASLPAGPVAQEVDPFTALIVELPVDAVLYVGQDASSVRIAAPPNMAKCLKVFVEEGTLHVSQGCHVSTLFLNERARAEITTKTLRGAGVQGSGTIHLPGIEADSLNLYVKGAGAIVASGAVPSLRIDIRGSGKVDVQDVEADRVEVNIRGSGMAVVTAKTSLNATVSGSGKVLYAGNPVQVEEHVRGKGKIAPL